MVRRPELTSSEAQDLGDLYRKRLESLRSVDDMIEGLIRALKETDQLDNTYVMFASDNGSSSSTGAGRGSSRCPR